LCSPHLLGKHSDEQVAGPETAGWRYTDALDVLSKRQTADAATYH
jgi:hypothetical protein